MIKKLSIIATVFGIFAWIGYASSQVGIGGVGTAPVGKTFTYKSTTTVTAPTVLNLTGLGNTWIFSVSGGTASFKLNSGDTIALVDEITMGGEMNYSISNPSITLLSLAPGATAFMYLDGIK